MEAPIRELVNSVSNRLKGSKSGGDTSLPNTMERPILVRGVSQQVLDNYDLMRERLKTVESWYNIRNDFQVMNFTKVEKDALDHVVELFESEDAKKKIRPQIELIKKTRAGGDGVVYKGCSDPGGQVFYKYMFIVRVGYNDTVDFHLASIEKRASLDYVRALGSVVDSLLDFTLKLSTGAIIVDVVSDWFAVWASAFRGKSASELKLKCELSELLTEFDMVNRLIDGNFATIKEDKKLYLLQ